MGNLSAAVLGKLTDAMPLLRGRAVVALTGAGISTRSGIPDYRGAKTKAKVRSPVQYDAFVGDPEARRRYWARATVGWPRFSAAQPNLAHQAVADLQAQGAVVGLITQNVDGLHGAAGSTDLVELHGTLSWVRCLDCGAREPRSELQARLIAANPSFGSRGAPMAPDGDAELSLSEIAAFNVVPCRACDGVLKPDVVFFGETVPRPVTDRAWATFARAETLLVVGSSLTVFSGYRFVRKAARDNVPVVIVNVGPTRGDAEAAVRIEADVVDVMPALRDLV